MRYKGLICALLVAALAVHGHSVKVSQFLLCGAGDEVASLQIVKDGLNTRLVFFCQLFHGAVARIGCWKRIIFYPAAAGILIEIVARAD